MAENIGWAYDPINYTHSYNTHSLLKEIDFSKCKNKEESLITALRPCENSHELSQNSRDMC